MCGTGYDLCRVNAEHYEQLVTMGYSKGTAAEALRQANNDILHALQVGKLFNGNIDGNGNINSYVVIDRVSTIEYYVGGILCLLLYCDW
jgi:hypothetical protein